MPHHYEELKADLLRRWRAREIDEPTYFTALGQIRSAEGSPASPGDSSGGDAADRFRARYAQETRDRDAGAPPTGATTTETITDPITGSKITIDVPYAATGSGSSAFAGAPNPDTDPTGYEKWRQRRLIEAAQNGDRATYNALIAAPAPSSPGSSSPTIRPRVGVADDTGGGLGDPTIVRTYPTDRQPGVRSHAVAPGDGAGAGDGAGRFSDEYVIDPQTAALIGVDPVTGQPLPDPNALTFAQRLELANVGQLTPGQRLQVSGINPVTGRPYADPNALTFDQRLQLAGTGYEASATEGTANRLFAGDQAALDRTHGITTQTNRNLFTGYQSALDRTFAGNQSALDRTFTGDQAALDRTFAGDQSALDRTFAGDQSELERLFGTNLQDDQQLFLGGESGLDRDLQRELLGLQLGEQGRQFDIAQALRDQQFNAELLSSGRNFLSAAYHARGQDIPRIDLNSPLGAPGGLNIEALAPPAVGNILRGEGVGALGRRSATRAATPESLENITAEERGALNTALLRTEGITADEFEQESLQRFGPARRAGRAARTLRVGV